MDLLRIITCGNVDDGKSTLLGRLLFETKSIMDDQWLALEQASRKRGGAGPNLAFLTDGLRAEREQGITIDVAYRYFTTARRKFVVADCPGHFQYTRNMVTGASAAQVALLLVDVNRGLTEQTSRHAFLSTLLGIRHLIVCVNKMDLVGYRQDAFEGVRERFMEFAERLESADIRFIPIAALHGDNLVSRSDSMPWYSGGPLLDTLETVYVRNDSNHVDARFPVQLSMPKAGGATDGCQHLAGQVASGVFRPGDEIIRLPAGVPGRIRRILGPSGPVPEAFHPMAVVVEVDDATGGARGDMLARPQNQPVVSREIEAMLCWLDEHPANPARRYLLRQTTRETACTIQTVRYKLDITSLHRNQDGMPLSMNDLARVALRCDELLCWDSYKKNRQTGSLLLVDPETNATVAAGMIL